jgi:hypothetical protein
MLPVQTVEIPKRMQHLRRDERGYPVFFTLGDDIQFKAIDGRRVVECAQRYLCGVCGQSLRTSITGTWFQSAFIGGAFSGLITGVFTDPLMHLECATYASEVCPWMVMQNFRRSDGAGTYVHEAGIDIRPEIFTMVSSTGYRLFEGGLFKAVRPKVIKMWKPGSNDHPTPDEVKAYLDKVQDKVLEGM